MKYDHLSLQININDCMYLYVLYIYGASKPKPYLILIGGCFMYYKKMFYNKIAYSKT